MYPHAHTRRHVARQILRSKRTLGWRTVLIVPELLHEVDQLEQGSDSRFAASQLRMERATIDTQLRRNQLQRLRCSLREALPRRRATSRTSPPRFHPGMPHRPHALPGSGVLLC